MKIFSRNILIFFLKIYVFAQHIDFGYTLEPPHLCFRTKIRKIGIPLHTPVFLHISGFKRVYIARTCFPDERKK